MRLLITIGSNIKKGKVSDSLGIWPSNNAIISLPCIEWMNVSNMFNSFNYE